MGIDVGASVDEEVYSDIVAMETSNHQGGHGRPLARDSGFKRTSCIDQVVNYLKMTIVDCDPISNKFVHLVEKRGDEHERSPAINGRMAQIQGCMFYKVLDDGIFSVLGGYFQGGPAVFIGNGQVNTGTSRNSLAENDGLLNNPDALLKASSSML